MDEVATKEEKRKAARRAWKLANKAKVHASEHARRKNRRAGVPIPEKLPAGARVRTPKPKPDGPIVPAIPQFIAIDGEGYTDAAGGHHYAYLAASTGEYMEQVGGLSSWDVFDWLLSLRKRYKKAVFVGYGLGYDVNCWLKDIHPRKLATIRRRNSALVYHPETNRLHRINWLPRTWVEIGCGDFYEHGYRSDTVIRVYDAHKFFGVPFVQALELWNIGTPEARQKIAAGKALRADFADISAATVIYNALELRLMGELMDALAAAAWRAGIYLTQWNGAGAVAGALLRKHQMHTYIENPAGYLGEQVIPRAYFGGRIQTLLPGEHGGCFLYDLNSAYGKPLLSLPDMRGGTWERVSRYTGRADFAVYKVAWRLPADTAVCPFPFRLPNGAIEYPYVGEGWYWKPEIDAARALYGSRLKILSGYIFHPADDARPTPFSWVLDVYRQRRQLADAGDSGAAFILKSAIAAVYGKLCQGQAAGGGEPRYRSLAWAGYITSYVRAEVLTAASQQSAEIVAFSTDGFLTRFPVDVPLGEGMGAWRVDRFIEALALQPGVFHAMTPAGTWVEKRRGFPHGRIDWVAAIDQWRAYQLGMHLPVAVDTFIGLAGARPDLADWRTWRREVKPLRAALSAGFPAWSPERRGGRLCWRVYGADMSGQLSAPYIEHDSTIAARVLEGEQPHR